MSEKLIGLTGPSGFTPECIDMLEEFYDADFVMLYHNNAENLVRWVDRCDGVCLAGGVDIHPHGVRRLDSQQSGLQQVRSQTRSAGDQDHRSLQGDQEAALGDLPRTPAPRRYLRLPPRTGPGRQFRLSPTGPATDHAAGRTNRCTASRSSTRTNTSSLPQW